MALVTPAVKVPAVLLTTELVKELTPSIVKFVPLFDICELLALKSPVTVTVPDVSLVIVLPLLAVRLPNFAVALLYKVEASVAKLVAFNVPAVFDIKLPAAKVVAPKFMAAALLIID